MDIQQGRDTGAALIGGPIRPAPTAVRVRGAESCADESSEFSVARSPYGWSRTPAEAALGTPVVTASLHGYQAAAWVLSGGVVLLSIGCNTRTLDDWSANGDVYAEVHQSWRSEAARKELRAFCRFVDAACEELVVERRKTTAVLHETAEQYVAERVRQSQASVTAMAPPSTTPPSPADRA